MALRATDNDDNSQFWCDERIKLGIHSSKIAPANMAFSYHLIFESIAFEIAACISMRTDHRLQQELSLQYPQYDGEEKAKAINQWYRQLHQAMYDQVAVLVKNTLPYKMPNYPVLDFMGYIERFEHDKGLFSAEWLERPQDLVLNPSILDFGQKPDLIRARARPSSINLLSVPFLSTS